MNCFQICMIFTHLVLYFDPLDAGGSQQTPDPKLPEPANITMYLISDYSHRSKFDQLGDFLVAMEAVFNNVLATLLPLNIRLHLLGISALTKQQQGDLYLFSKKADQTKADIAEVTLLQWIQSGRIENVSVPVDIVALISSVPFTAKYPQGFSRINDTCNQFGNPGLALVRDVDGTYLVDLPLTQHILHLVGSHFDAEGHAADCDPSSGHLMSNDYSKEPYTPSDCTKKEVYRSLKEKIENGCFHDTGVEKERVVASLAGELPIMQRLCISYDPSKKHLRNTVEVCKPEVRATYIDSHHDDECAVLCCSGGKVAYKKRDLNGIQCTSKDKFCVNGKCVNREDWKNINLPGGSIEIKPHVP